MQQLQVKLNKKCEKTVKIREILVCKIHLNKLI